MRKKVILSFLLAGLISVATPQQKTAEEYYNKYISAWNSSDFLTARRYLDSVQHMSSTLSDYHRAIVFKNIAKVLRKQGQVDSALFYFEKSIPLLIKDNRYLNQLAGSYNGIGNVYLSKGEHIRANAYYKRALELLEQKDQKNERDRILNYIIYENQSEVYKRLNDHIAALNLLYQSRDIRDKFKIGDPGIIQLKLATAYEHMNYLDSAGHYYNLAVKSIENHHGQDYFMLAIAYLRYAEFLQNNRDVSSEKYFRKSLKIYHSAFGDESPYTANCHAAFSNHLIQQERFVDANSHINTSLQILGTDTPNRFRNHSSVQHSNHDLNYIRALKIKMELHYLWSKEIENTELKKEKLLVALQCGEKILKTYKKIHAFFFTNQSKQFLLSNQKEILLTFYDISMSLYHLKENAQYIRNAFKYISMSKGYDLYHEKSIDELMDYPIIPEQLASQIKSEIAAVSAFSEHTARQNIDYTEPIADHNYYNTMLVASYTRLDSLLHLAKVEYPEFANVFTQYKEPDLKTIQKNLKKDEVLIEYFIEPPKTGPGQRLIVFLIEQKELKLLDTLIQTGMLEDIRLEYEVLSGEQYENKKTEPPKAGFLYELYSILLKPFEKEIEGKALYVIPDEELSYLPFDILLTSEIGPSEKNPATFPYLIRKHAVSYGYSSQLLFNQTKNRKSTCFTSIVPDYTSTAENNVPPLMMAKEETRAISEVFRDNSIHEGYLSKKTFLQLLESNCNLHLAMHTETDSLNSRKAYFILTNKEGDIIRCMHHEIEARDIHAPLVSLAACKTGSGMYYSGDGLLNISRSFLLSGAGSVLHTMWDVEDKVSAMIMEQFYTYLSKGYKKNEALRRAKLHYINTISPAFSAPEYWAAYQLTGDPSPVTMNHKHKKILVILGIVIVVLCTYFFILSRRERSSPARF